MASSKYSSPPAPVIGKIGPYTVFLTPPPTPAMIPSQSPSPSPSPSPRNIVHPRPSPATPVRPPTADSPRPPPVLPPPVQYAKPGDDDRFGFLSSAIARVLHVHSSVDEYVANWLGLNKSRRREMQNLMKHLAKFSAFDSLFVCQGFSLNRIIQSTTMYASQFDGSAAFAGGGFMPSQVTQGPDSSFSFSKPREAQGLTPLTVKQIGDAQSSASERGNFIIDGVDVNNVKVVGMVRNRVERTTDVGFIIDDGTGRIEIHRCDGMYVSVFGHLKGFQGKKQITAYAVRPVTDFNELTCHFIECAYVHDYNTRPRRVAVGGALPTEVQATASVNGTSFRGYQATPSNQFAAQHGYEGLKGIEEKVMQYLQQPSSLAREKGVHRDELAQRLGVPVEKIMESIRTLEGEGLVYSTIDDFHFKKVKRGSNGFAGACAFAACTASLLHYQHRRRRLRPPIKARHVTCLTGPDDQHGSNVCLSAADDDDHRMAVEHYLRVAPLSVQAPASAFENSVVQIPPAGPATAAGYMDGSSEQLKAAMTTTAAATGSCFFLHGFMSDGDHDQTSSIFGGEADQVSPPALLGPPALMPQEEDKKSIVPVDHSTFGHRTSIFRGVT
ncbi:Replication protein A 32 kDa subunit A-like protein, partial [Drosera capensis]